jgi:glycosyltransferase involved in cell wall biosynthesis
MREGKIGWIFPRIMGTNTLFSNVGETAHPELAARSVWIGLSFRRPAPAIRRLPLPGSLRVSLDLLSQALNTLRNHPDVSTLVIANLPQSPVYLPLVMRYATYFSIDITPSLIRHLSPWYDALLPPRGAMGSIQGGLLRTTYQQAAGIFPWSKWAGEGVRLDFGVPADRIHVALPGADVRKWPYVDRSTRGSSQVVRILMVGREFQRKGGDMLLDWAARTTAYKYELDLVTGFDQLPEWVRTNVGNPLPDQVVSAALAPHLPHVRVHCGYRANSPELLRLYREADIFCLPTHADTSSIASLEAMASGLPVVVSAVGGIPELILDGRTGLLVRPGDSTDLNSKLEALLNDPALRHRLGAAARAACEDYFNVDRLSHQIVTTLEQDDRQPILKRSGRFLRRLP